MTIVCWNEIRTLIFVINFFKILKCSRFGKRQRIIMHCPRAVIYIPTWIQMRMAFRNNSTFKYSYIQIWRCQSAFLSSQISTFILSKQLYTDSAPEKWVSSGTQISRLGFRNRKTTRGLWSSILKLEKQNNWPM